MKTKELLLNPTSTAQWQALVDEAQTAAEQRLDEAMESYLVFLLMRFTNKPEIASRILAIDYLESFSKQGTLRHTDLRDVGDQCLLFSGLFPLQARRRRVKISYFVELGRSAYHTLSEEASRGAAELYNNLAHTFVELMEVLQSIRRLGLESPCLSPLEAYDLWHETGSRGALRALQEHRPNASHPTPIAIPTPHSDPDQKH